MVQTLLELFVWKYEVECDGRGKNSCVRRIVVFLPSAVEEAHKASWRKVSLVQADT